MPFHCSPPKPRGALTCKQCGETYTQNDLAELRELHELYWLEGGIFICPDCWDAFRRGDLEEQFLNALEE